MLTEAQAAAAPQRLAAILLLWTVVLTALTALLWPGGRGRRVVRQTLAVSTLAFREAIRMKILWTVMVLGLIPAVMAYFSDGDGTHAGRAKLILSVCLSVGEILGAALLVLISALSVAREIESRVMYTLGTKPVPRFVILAGKALGFWAVDIMFLLALALLAALLVRAVPLRPETHAGHPLVATGTWEDLRRNALVTRNYLLGVDEDTQNPATYKFLKAGESATWRFMLDEAPAGGEAPVLRLELSSSWTFNPEIGLKLTLGYAGQTPVMDQVISVPQDHMLQLPLPAAALTRAGPIDVTLQYQPPPGLAPPNIIVQKPGGVEIGRVADSFLRNLGKAFLLMALQGWMLAVITTAWSGVLSFPVTVALGLTLVLGGEMSRQALDLLKAGAERAQMLDQTVGSDNYRQFVIEYLRMVLRLLPDFRAAGGPAAFLSGTVVSGGALWQAAFWMGIVRSIGWALPGVWLFRAREVGR